MFPEKVTQIKPLCDMDGEAGTLDQMLSLINTL